MKVAETAIAMLMYSVGFIAVAVVGGPLAAKATDFIGGRGA